MKTMRTTLTAVAVSVLGFATSAHATMPVIDLSNIMQTVKVLEANKAQLTKLGSMLNVNTDQLNSLKGISTTIGNAQDIMSFGKKFTPAELGRMMSKVPGMEKIDLSKVFKTSGALDLFSKVPLDQWDKMIKNPRNYYTQMLMSEAVKHVGEDIGLDTAEIRFINDLKSQDPRWINKMGTARDLADIMFDRWQKEGKQRRQNLQTVAETTNAKAQAAMDEKTVVGQAAGQTAVLAETAKIQAMAAEHATEAAEKQVDAIEQGNKLLEEQIRNERLRASLRGIGTR